MDNTQLIEGVDFKREMDWKGTTFTFLTEKAVQALKEAKEAGRGWGFYDSLGLVPGHA